MQQTRQRDDQTPDDVARASGPLVAGRKVSLGTPNAPDLASGLVMRHDGDRLSVAIRLSQKPTVGQVCIVDGDRVAVITGGSLARLQMRLLPPDDGERLVKHWLESAAERETVAG